MKRITFALALCLAAQSTQAGFVERSKHAAKASAYSAAFVTNSLITYMILKNMLGTTSSQPTKSRNAKSHPLMKGVDLYVLAMISLTSKWAAKNAYSQWKQAFSTTTKSHSKDMKNETSN